MYYQIIKVGNEEIGLVWKDGGRKPQVEYIYLPRANQKMAVRIAKDFPQASKIPRRIPGGIDKLIAGFYEGRKLKFDLSLLNFSRLSNFSAKVLKQLFKIPRGKVVTYSGLAAKIGSPRACRAVGTAMANNPFPVIIPCHRVIRADGAIGRFGGGAGMKKELLKKEGIVLDNKSIVPKKYICG
jgi:methylated-DNA-[protein]-cysteine S-methyltransferase